MQQQAIEKVIEQAGVDLKEDVIFGKNLEEVLEYCQTAEPIDGNDPKQWSDEEVAEVLAAKMGIDENVLYILMECRRDPELAHAVNVLLHQYQELEAEEPGAGLEFVEFIRDFSNACREAREEVENEQSAAT